MDNQCTDRQLSLWESKEEPTIQLKVKHCNSHNRHGAHLYLSDLGRRVCPGDSGVTGG